MDINLMEKQERSISISARADVVTLAELAKYWIESEGANIRSVSQLISWSLDLLREALQFSGKSSPEFDVVSALKYLEFRGLRQESLKKRNFAKVATAVRFSEMRKEGLDPMKYDPLSFNKVHNERSVNPLVRNASSREAEIYEEMKRKAREGARSSNSVIPRPLTEEELLTKANEIIESDEALVKQMSGVSLDELKKSAGIVEE